MQGALTGASLAAAYLAALLVLVALRILINMLDLFLKNALKVALVDAQEIWPPNFSLGKEVSHWNFRPYGS